MFDWLKKHKKAQVDAPQATPQQAQGQDSSAHLHINFNPSLVERLKSEHQLLLSIYTDILAAVGAKNYPLISEKLNDFGINLKAHLLTEHIELYIYLEYILSTDKKTFEYMHELRMEMDDISSEVIGFLHSYKTNPVNDNNVDAFKQQFEKIGHILSERIEREEKTLYILYTSVS